MKAEDLAKGGGGRAESGGMPPKDITPGALVSRLLAEGRPAFAVVPFPRFKEDGSPVCNVHVRILTVGEEDVCLANARKYVADKLRTKEADLPWRPEELEYNAQILEVLAIACRDPDNPEEPFFRMGVVEARKFFNSEELGVLANVYTDIKTRNIPGLKNMTEEEVEAWVDALSEDWDVLPFAYYSRRQLETLCERLAKLLVSQRRSSTGQTSTSSSSSD